MTEKQCSRCERRYLNERDFLQWTSNWKVCSSGKLWFSCRCGALLSLGENEYPWYQPQLRVRSEHQSLFEQLMQRRALPYLPTSVMELQQKLVNPATETTELVRVVKQDPLMATEVIAAFDAKRQMSRALQKPLGSGSEITYDLAYAISYLGRRQLAAMALVAAFRRFKLQTKVFADQEFWQHSRATALIAESLWLNYVMDKDGDLAYIAGGLCNIGKMVLALAYPHLADRMTTYLKDPQTVVPWPVAEKILGVPDHRILGLIAGAVWGFPLWASAVIEHHHADPQQVHRFEYGKLVSVVALATMLVHEIRGERKRNRPGALSLMCEELGISASQRPHLAHVHASALHGVLS